MQRVAIVGAGLIGRAWALVFARAGWEVRVTDPADEACHTLQARLRDDLAPLVKHEICTAENDILQRISVAADLPEALDGATLVQENGPEDVDAKRAIFTELDRLAPHDAILASSTSAIVASHFTEKLAGRARCLVAHPVNPPHLVPLVELCGAPWTDTSVIERARTLYASIGQAPITVASEVEGFVLNRLQGALLAEAFRLVADGVVSPEDLDRTLKDGLGLRWSFMGPFETIELNAPGGIRDYCERYCAFYARLADDPPGSAAFGEQAREAVANAWPHAPTPARLAARTAWRNDRLAALCKHKDALAEGVEEENEQPGGDAAREAGTKAGEQGVTGEPA